MRFGVTVPRAVPSGAAIALAVFLSSTAAQALPVSGFAGYDHSRGPLERRSDGIVAGAGLELAGFELAAAGLRYDDTVMGRGYGLTGIAGLPLAPFTQARFAVTRFLGDETYRAWRFRIGPRFASPTGQTLWLAWMHDQDNAGARTNGAFAEGMTPLAAGLTGRMNATWVPAPETGAAAMGGAVGLGWRALPQLELNGEVGVARNAAAGGGWFPGRGIGGLPSIGNGTPSEEWGATALIGFRVLVP